MVFQVYYKALKQGFINVDVPSEAHVKRVTFKDDYIELYLLIREGYNKDDTNIHKFYGARKGDTINPLIRIDEVVEAKDEWILFSIV